MRSEAIFSPFDNERGVLGRLVMKRHAPATARNGNAIAKVLRGELPEAGLVLEIASGTGEHALRFASDFPNLQWQPSDTDEEALSSADAWREAGGSPRNLLPALRLDAGGTDWPIDQADALVCINMTHISPWGAVQGLFAGAARILPSDAPLLIYGPFREADTTLALSNEAFDASLRSRDPRWGLRQLAQLDALGRTQGFKRTARYEMPANNLTLVYRTQANARQN